MTCHLRLRQTSALYLVGPHEADEENDGKSNSEDVDAPEPGPLDRCHEEAFYDTWLECAHIQKNNNNNKWFMIQ